VSVGFAFALTVLAGLATGLGSVLALFAKRTNTRMLSVALGFSAGVMIYVSLVEILQKSQEAFEGSLGLDAGGWAALASFLGGIALIAVIDRLVPTFENPHTVRRLEEMEESEVLRDITVDAGGGATVPLMPAAMAHEQDPRLLRMGLLSALAIGIHNFPEGLATFIAALEDPKLGVSIAVAIAIHNVPEGIAVAIPVYYATGSRRKAFIYSALSGLSEPVGALIGYLFLRSFFNDITFGIMFGIVAGIMVFISLDELLPTAREYGEHHLAVYGLIAGMAVMGVSLVIML